jgi:fucose 4-O-acetylase-like acetyltransferase
MTASTLAAAPGQAAGTVRHAWVDQARWAAVSLVVVGHLVGLLRARSDLAKAVSDFVYLFHIPALVLLAGWGSRRGAASARGLSRVVWQLLVPYALFQIVAFLLGHALRGTTPTWSFTHQTFGLWFLVTLAGWRLLAPWFQGFRHPELVALVLALLAGLSPVIDETFSLSRMLVFLPLFLAGPELVDRVGLWRQNRMLRAAAALALASALAFVAWQGRDFDRTVFFGRDSYRALSQGPLDGAAERLAMLAVSTVLATALLLVVPGRTGAPSRLGAVVAGWGRRTLYVYLLHLPLLLVVGSTGWPARGSAEAAAVVAIVAGFVLAGVLASRPVSWVARVLVEPRQVVDAALAAVRRTGAQPAGPTGGHR